MDTPTPILTDPDILDPEALDPAASRRFLRRARRLAARLPFVRDLTAMAWTLRDRDTPPHVRAIVVAAIAYFVLPIDAIPDMLAGFGFTDDAAVVLAALKTVGPWIQPHHRDAADAWLDGDPRPDDDKDEKRA